jgi:hypothetical protein
MFVRWTEDGPTCRAVLVDSMRTPLWPRLKHVAYLGPFKENNLAQDSTRAWFWQSARRRLDRLGICGKITSRERDKIEAALAQRVPPITPEQEATSSGPGLGGCNWFRKLILVVSRFFEFPRSQDHSRRICDVGRESALPSILLQKSKVASVRIFGETLKHEAIDDSDNLSRATEVAYEFSVMG